MVNGTENNYQTFQGQEEEKELGKNTYAFQWRDYDPAIARFNKIDRFAEKYYDQSPYHFTKNNPIRFVEVAGDSIWISSKEGNLLYENNKLYSRNDDGGFDEYKGKLARTDKEGNVKGYKGILGSAVKSLNKLGEKSEFANNIISTLQGSENNFTINPSNNTLNYVRVDLGRDGKTGILNNNAYAFQVLSQGENLVDYAPFNQIGSGGVINWNPSSGIIGLGHELGHAYDANFGMLDSRRVPINGGTEEIREIRAVYYENRIRQDLGKGLRKDYGGPSLLDNNKNPIFYQTPLPSIFNFRF